MRRHVMLFRSMKRRYRLVRPKYSLRVLWYGGTTFTMLVFSLLLVTSGLMYFYFNKCRVQERELEKWRAGLKVEKPAKAQASPTQKIKGVVSAVGDSLRSMPKPSIARSSEPEKVAVQPQAKQVAAAKPQTAARIVEPTVADEAEKVVSDETPVITKATPDPERKAPVLGTQKPRASRPAIAQADDPEAKWAAAVANARTVAPKRIESAYDAEAEQPESARSTTGDRISVKLPKSTTKNTDDPIGSYLQTR